MRPQGPAAHRSEVPSGPQRSPMLRMTAVIPSLQVCTKRQGASGRSLPGSPGVGLATIYERRESIWSASHSTLMYKLDSGNRLATIQFGTNCRNQRVDTWLHVLDRHVDTGIPKYLHGRCIVRRSRNGS